MNAKVATALLVIFAVIALAWIVLGTDRKPEGLYQGKNLRALVEHAVLDGDTTANSELKSAISSADAHAKAQIQRALADCALGGLRTRDLFILGTLQ